MSSLVIGVLLLLAITAIARAGTLYLDWRLIRYGKRDKAQVLGGVSTLAWLVTLTVLVFKLYLVGG